MRRRRHLDLRFFTVIAVILFVCLVSALYSGISGNPSPITTAVGIVTAPVQKLFTGIGGMMGKGMDYFTEFDNLRVENEELKRRISEMEQTLRDATLALEENKQLRQQQGMPERTRELTTITAEVIAHNPGQWAETLTLSRGSANGVEVNDLVITNDGMVGYVSSVAPNYCEVTTVIDVEMQCGALITRTRENAIAEGNYDLMVDGYLQLSYLKENSDVTSGDTVETSGKGGVFPRGIMIGTVENVQPTDNGISYYAVIKPRVDVETVTSVSIVTSFNTPD